MKIKKNTKLHMKKLKWLKKELNHGYYFYRDIGDTWKNKEEK